MTRILARLRSFGAGGVPPYVETWSQRVAEQIEAQFDSVFAALASMGDLADVHVQADYTGAINADQLPLNVIAKRYTGETDNSADAVWSFTTDNGGITATIDGGVLTITDVAATERVTITSVYGDVAKSRSFTVYLDTSSPPSTGTAGGTSASDSTFSTFNSETHAAVSDELSVTIGSAGQAQLSAPLNVLTASVAPAGAFPVYLIWRHWNGASWDDVGTESLSSPNCVVDQDEISGAYFRASGRVSASQTVTGLTASATEKFQLYARNDAGTRTMSLNGTASVVAS